MAQVDANKIIDALAFKLGRAQLDSTINEIALAEAEARISELQEDTSEPGDIPKDSTS